MRVLVACECSGRVKMAFRNKGHDAWSCDLKPSEITNDKFHYQCDIREVLNNGWDLMIAHPDCTYLSIMGGVWMNKQPERINKVKEASVFFNYLLNQEINKIAIENPIPNKWARQYIRHYDQLIQPYYFGEAYKKGTCLWLKGLPPLMFTLIHGNPKCYVSAGAKGKTNNGIGHSKTDRARTFQGIANAMATQWG